MNIVNQVGKIWQDLANNATNRSLQFDLEIQKRLLNFFQVGDYYYYIFNVKESRLEYLSNETIDVLGYQPQELDVPFILNSIHPEDQPWFVQFEERVLEFFANLTEEQILNYKVRYDYRIRKKDGTYIRILQQVITIQFDENRGILRTFGVHTDITHLKKERHPVLSFIGLQGQPSYIDVQVNTNNLCKLVIPNSFTKRERQILTLLIEGKTSEVIAKQLYISKLTVDVHRKNLLQKAGCTNTAILVSRSVKEGWV